MSELDSIIENLEAIGIVRNLRTVEIGHGTDPVEACKLMKAAGFVFVQEGCPYILKQPFECVEIFPGMYQWRQWDHDA